MRRNRVIRKAVRQRFAITLKNNEGTFAGVLLESDPTTWVFDQCSTIPKQAGQTSDPIQGRVYVDRANIAYLQELPL